MVQIGLAQASRRTASVPHVCPTCRLRAHIRRQRRTFTVNSSLADKHAGGPKPVKVAPKLNGNEGEEDVRAGRGNSILSLLEKRGFINQIVGERHDLERLVTKTRAGVYLGVDPTAPSLHVGHLVPFMALYWMYSYGFPAFTVLGGATAKIGDPSGRLKARAAQSDAEQRNNADKIHQQVEKLWLNVERELERNALMESPLTRQREVVNNKSWFDGGTRWEMVEWLMGAGVGIVLGRATARSKINNDAMSVAELIYPELQAWDFWHLYSTKGVQIQIGGSDQFGNILAGKNAIKRNHDDSRAEQDHRRSNLQEAWVNKAMGFTIPLLTSPTGEKFGKSAGNAIWLDASRTSPFDLYQFFLKTADDNVHRYLKLFTFDNLESLDELMKSHDEDRSKRVAQHALAKSVLRLAHGDEAAEKARNDHARLFPPRSEDIAIATHGAMRQEQIVQYAEGSVMNDAEASSDYSSTDITLPQSLVFHRPIAHVLFHAGLVGSKSEGHRLCAAKGVYVGVSSAGGGEGALQWRRVDHDHRGDAGRFVINGTSLLLRAGKTKIKVVAIISDEEFEARGLGAPGWEGGRGQDEKSSLKDGSPLQQIH